jgi:hypothetical protein
MDNWYMVCHRGAGLIDYADAIFEGMAEALIWIAIHGRHDTHYIVGGAV